MSAFLVRAGRVKYPCRMHEMSFAEQILDCVVGEAGRYPGSRVARVKLRSGEMLALEPASLRFCLEAISVGTVMANAEIDLEETRAELDCPTCGPTPIGSLMEPVCPTCGHVGRIAAATELIVEEIELDGVEEDQA